MNETERIIEVTGYSKQVPITWHEDPTRHLLKQKAVNAKSSSDTINQPSRVDKSLNDKKDSRAS